jgi:hypothetical protein
MTTSFAAVSCAHVWAELHERIMDKANNRLTNEIECISEYIAQNQNLIGRRNLSIAKVREEFGKDDSDGGYC